MSNLFVPTVVAVKGETARALEMRKKEHKRNAENVISTVTLQDMVGFWTTKST